MSQFLMDVYVYLPLGWFGARFALPDGVDTRTTWRKECDTVLKSRILPLGGLVLSL